MKTDTTDIEKFFKIINFSPYLYVRSFFTLL